MHIGIVGSRRRNTPQDKELVENELKKFLHLSPIIVSGGCPKGADRFAEELAQKYNLQTIIHYPDKSSLPAEPQRYHFAQINFARNTLIARDSDILIAVVASDRKGGTEHTIRQFLMHFKKKPSNLILLTEPDSEFRIDL